MLTLILLVVLGGGVGLVAVSLAESSKPATDAGPVGREPGSGRDSTEPPEPPESDEPDEPAAPPPEPPSAPVVRRAEPVAQAPAPVAVLDHGPPRRRSRGDVPKAYTAVEGRYRDVARAPLWRRLVSLVLIVAIAALCGVVIAAVLGGAIGAASEIIGNTIG